MKYENEDRIKKDFARLFGWLKRGSYYAENEYRTPEWAEIFAKIGSLLEKAQYDGRDKQPPTEPTNHD